MEVPPQNHEPKKQEGGVGPLVGIVIIVVLLLAGGIYFLITQAKQIHQNSTDQEQVNS